MIAKVFTVALCVLQVVLGQQTPEQDLRDLISQANDEMNDYILPLVTRMQHFGNSFGDEARRLEAEEADLRQELEALADQLGNGKEGVSICLTIALEDADRIFRDRENELAAFHTVEFNSFKQIFDDLSLVSQEEEDLVRETEQSIQTCNSLATSEEVDACNTELIGSFDVMKADILNRLSELYKLGQDALRISEENQEAFNDGNRQFVRESSQVTTDELTTCIEKL